MIFAVALTGDIGAGKSTLGGLWKSLGATVMNADLLVQELWASHQGLRAQVRQRWGEDLFDSRGILRKELLLSRVFCDAREYRILCGAIHPLVEELMEREYARSSGFFVAEIPLLFERGMPWWADLSVYVAAPREIRLERLCKKGKSPSWLEGMESWLLPREERRNRADVVLENAGDLGAFRERAGVLGRRFQTMASAVEMELCCGSLEEGRALAVLLKERSLGVHFSLFPKEPWDGEKARLTWFSPERLFPEVRFLLEERFPGRAFSLRSRSLRRAERALLNHLAEVCG